VHKPASRIDDFEDMFENSPCGYITLQTNGRIARVNKTLLGWTGHTADDMVGKRFSDFVNMAGRIYYETHIAPLLRMQGFFNEFAIEMVTAAGEPMQMICNALEGRDGTGKPLFTRLALLKATDRRRYEQELLAAREAAKTSMASERETSELREQFIAVLGHDLRNPLASISAGARILGRGQRATKSIKSSRCSRPRS
jgi:sigma-B regulation protein RsbU (phosphoserine phosphatase)